MSFLSKQASKNAGGVYGIRCLANGRIYIGSAIDLKSRWYNHRYELRVGKHFNPHLQNAWKKYGPDAFEFFIVELVDSALLVARETAWISSYKSTDKKHGFNVNPTGNSRLGVPHTLETKKKMSLLKKGNQARLGQHHTVESKKKISDTQKGKFVSAETRAKLALANSGKKNSIATREKISAANKGVPKPASFGAKIAEARAFFNEDQVRDLRAAHAAGVSHRRLAEIHKTSHGVVGKAVNGIGPFYSKIQ